MFYVFFIVRLIALFESDVSSIGCTNANNTSVLEKVKTVMLVKIDYNNFLERGNVAPFKPSTGTTPSC